MNLLADESVDQLIVDRLRNDGHDVVYVAELAPSISDDDVLSRASSHQSVLITSDKDFGELVFRQGRVHGGVILLQLSGLSSDLKASIVGETIRDRIAEIPSKFTVISPGLVRIRPRL